MTTNNNPTPAVFLDALAVGRSSTNPFLTVFSPINPTTNDVNYPIQTRWFNQMAETEYILTAFSVVGEIKTAIWQPINASQVAAAETLTGNSGGAVGVDGNNNINVIGDTTTINVTGNPGTHTLTISTVGTGVVNTLTGNSGGAVSPLAGNINTIGDGTTINIVGNPGTHTLTASTGGTVATIYTENTGTATPSAGNLNIFGTNAASTSGSGSTVTINAIDCAKWIVDPTAGVGTHTTIGAAIASASSGQTIFVRPGTYTENLTLKAGVNITAFLGDAFAPNVIVVGKATFNGNGTTVLSNLNLQTNGDFFLVVSGSSASVIYLNQCFLNCSNHAGISYTSSSSSSSVIVNSCLGNVSGATSTLFTSSSAGTLLFQYSSFNNTGNSTAVSTVSAGLLGAIQSRFTFPISTSSTGALSSVFNDYECAAINSIPMTIGGSGGAAARGDGYTSGTASAISIGTSMTVAQIEVDTSNANAVTGAGTLNAGIITFTGTSSNINTSTVNKLTTFGGTIV